ncbi:MAG: aldehyde ferredoxin oxidoreductase family protein [Thermoleophilia bacterium]
MLKLSALEQPGVFGKTVWVDLSAGSVRSVEETPGYHRRFLGGAGAAVYQLLRSLRPGTDALAPENVLVFAPGLLAGTQSPATPRYVACGRSPLTGALGKSESSGYWGPELKRAGVGVLGVIGRAAEPSYLLVTADGVEIRSALRIWGLTTGDAEEIIKDEVGDPRVRVAIIGPGGENRVRYAGIASDLTHFNGRNGLGAVMGSKNLKAVAVCGSSRLEVHDRERIKDIARSAARLCREHPLSRMLHEDGTPAGVEITNAGGALATRNWQNATFEAADKIGGTVLNGQYLVKRDGCYACPVMCKRVVAVDGEKIRVEQRYGGPEYETLVAFGSNCGVADFEAIAKANELCNMYTLDTISTGMCISFAMACFQAGIIGREDTGGLDVRFGDSDIVLTLIEQIAHRKGFGDLLAEGSVRAAAALGRGADAHVLAVKGQELPFQDPRVKTGLGLQFALAPNGADHWFAQHDPLYGTETSPGVAALAPLGLLGPVSPLDIGPAKVRAIRQTSVLNSLYDCLGVCIFGAVARSMTSINSYVDLVSAATGWETSLWELMHAGERALAMSRVFNVREGFGPAADTLPSLFFTPFADGPLAGQNALDPDRFADAVRLYYEMSGWDSVTGMPTPGKMAELGLDEAFA